MSKAPSFAVASSSYDLKWSSFLEHLDKAHCAMMANWKAAAGLIPPNLEMEQLRPEYMLQFRRFNCHLQRFSSVLQLTKFAVLEAAFFSGDFHLLPKMAEYCSTHPAQLKEASDFFLSDDYDKVLRACHHWDHNIPFTIVDWFPSYGQLSYIRGVHINIFSILHGRPHMAELLNPANLSIIAAFAEPCRMTEDECTNASHLVLRLARFYSSAVPVHSEVPSSSANNNSSNTNIAMTSRKPRRWYNTIESHGILERIQLDSSTGAQTVEVVLCKRDTRRRMKFLVCPFCSRAVTIVPPSEEKHFRYTPHPTLSWRVDTNLDSHQPLASHKKMPFFKTMVKHTRICASYETRAAEPKYCKFFCKPRKISKQSPRSHLL